MIPLAGNPVRLVNAEEASIIDITTVASQASAATIEIEDLKKRMELQEI